MSDIIGVVVPLATIGLVLLYRMGWWHGYRAAQREYMETLSRQEGKNWHAMMKERMRKEEADGKR